MPLLMLRQDFEPCSDREAKQRNERILEPDAVDVVVSCAVDEFARVAVAAEKLIENVRVHFRAGCNRLRGTAPSGFGGRGDVLANEPSTEPPGGDLMNH